MSKKLFTEKQIIDLRNNPYTNFVSEKRIRFTPGFEDEFWKLHQKGKSPAKIFRQLGYDPAVLGKSRIYSFASRLSRSRTDLDQLNLSRQNQELARRVSVLEAEIDFLKKALAMTSIQRRKHS